MIAGDVNNTSLISKLESLDGIKTEQSTFKATLENLPKSKYIDKSNIGINSSLLSNKKTSSTVLKNLAEIMKK